jgi:hypothetical protein
MDDMIKMMANAKEEDRKKMITERFGMIASQPEEQRVTSIKAILLAVAKLNPEKKKAFIRTRTNVLVDAPPQVRDSIQKARVKAGSQVSDEVNQSDMVEVIGACSEWSEEKCGRFKQNLGKAFKAEGMEMPDVDKMMKNMAEMKKEMKKPWYKFW